MKIDDQVKQLKELMAELVPGVDRLTQNQEKNTDAINRVIKVIAKTNIQLSEMRVPNMWLVDVMERLATKIDKIDEFEDRLVNPHCSFSMLKKNFEFIFG